MTGPPKTAAVDLTTSERFVPMREKLGVRGFGINQLTLRPGQRMRIHRHAGQEEVYVVIAGRLTVFVDGQPHTIAAGELMRIAPETRRQLANIHREPVTIVALGSHGVEHQSRDAECFTAWDQADGAPPREVPLPDDLPESELQS